MASWKGVSTFLFNMLVRLIRLIVTNLVKSTKQIAKKIQEMGSSVNRILKTFSYPVLLDKF